MVKSEIYAQKLDYVNQGVLEDFIRKKLKTQLLQYGDKMSVKKYIFSLKNKIREWGRGRGAGSREHGSRGE
ncbi:hypothetical protein [Nostoc sp. ChiVER01]|uniref:hypothetical protein n=1 Tax=Nostoc sp. ChiVER01 TaxID=3075382 RepID=UPI002AD41067|nr:hypothetical protein [Nostoc sp. ChiVER01]MDZ8225623.1 hypothetical protein [Nostoc sp. ChiVER01]